LTHFFGQCSTEKLEKLCSFWHSLTKARRLAYLRQLDALNDLFIAEGEEKVNRLAGNGYSIFVGEFIRLNSSSYASTQARMKGAAEAWKALNSGREENLQ